MNDNARPAVKLVNDSGRIAKLFQGCSLEIYHWEMMVGDIGILEEGDLSSCVRILVEADDNGYFVVLQELDGIARNFLAGVVRGRGPIETI